MRGPREAGEKRGGGGELGEVTRGVGNDAEEERLVELEEVSRKSLEVVLEVSARPERSASLVRTATYTLAHSSQSAAMRQLFASSAPRGAYHAFQPQSE